MFAAGPGTITAVATLAAVHTPHGFPITAIIASAVGAGITCAALLVAIQLGSRLKRSTPLASWGSLGSMGMQFVLEGLKAFLGA
jgi:small neutral amino acid transporter SnatA (MarC family)